MINRVDNDSDAYFDAVERWVEEGSEGIRPLFCAKPSCDCKIMDFDIVSRIYRCPKCGFEVHKDDVDLYLQEILKGKNEEEE